MICPIGLVLYNVYGRINIADMSCFRSKQNMLQALPGSRFYYCKLVLMKSLEASCHLMEWRYSILKSLHLIIFLTLVLLICQPIHSSTPQILLKMLLNINQVPPPTLFNITILSLQSRNFSLARPQGLQLNNLIGSFLLQGQITTYLLNFLIDFIIFLGMTTYSKHFECMWTL